MADHSFVRDRDRDLTLDRERTQQRGKTTHRSGQQTICNHTFIGKRPGLPLSGRTVLARNATRFEHIEHCIVRHISSQICVLALRTAHISKNTAVTHLHLIVTTLWRQSVHTSKSVALILAPALCSASTAAAWPCAAATIKAVRPSSSLTSIHGSDGWEGSDARCRSAAFCIASSVGTAPDLAAINHAFALHPNNKEETKANE